MSLSDTIRHLFLATYPLSNEIEEYVEFRKIKVIKASKTSFEAYHEMTLLYQRTHVNVEVALVSFFCLGSMVSDESH